MASERQIAANRKNAKQSTGPQTAAGKQRSKRNALKHGLARSSSDDEAQIRDLGVSIAGALGRETLLEEALVFARAKLRLAEVRRVRDGMLATLLDAPFDLNLKAIHGLERYHRAALTEHKRAVRSLCAKSEEGMDSLSDRLANTHLPAGKAASMDSRPSKRTTKLEASDR